MARRSARRTATPIPKTLTGILASIALTVLAALGIKTDGFHGKPAAPPTERPTANTKAVPPPGDLPNTPGTFVAAKQTLYNQVYFDHRITFYVAVPTARIGKSIPDLVHTVLEWMDDPYRLLRQKRPSRRQLFNDLRALTSYLYFDSWDDLMTFMLRSFEPGRVAPVRLEPSPPLQPAPP